MWLTPNSEESKQKLSKALGNKTVTQKSVSGRNWSKEPGRSESWSEKCRALLTPEEIGRLGKEEVIITGKGMFPIRTNRVSYYKDHRFKALNDSQKGKPWPDVPVVKDRIVTRFDEFLKSAWSAKSSEFEEPEPEPVAKPSLSQRATVTGPRTYDPPEYDEYLDQGVAGYGYFEDPRETTDDEETAEDRQLKQAMESVKAPSFADNLGNLLNLAPINPDSEPELADLAHRLSPEELVNRLMPLFSGENVKISGYSPRGA